MARLGHLSTNGSPYLFKLCQNGLLSFSKVPYPRYHPMSHSVEIPLAETSTSKRGIFGPWLRLIVSAMMVALVFVYTDVEKLGQTLHHVPVAAFLAAIVGYSFSQCLSALRWYLLVRAGGLDCTLSRVLRAHFIGVYVNAFGLGTVGGDLSKALLLVGSGKNKTFALASVATDRVVGLGVLAAIGAVASFIVHGDPALGLARSVGLLVGGGALLALFLGTVGRRVLKRLSHPVANKLVAALAAIPHRPTVIALVISVAVLFHLVQISIYYLITLLCGYPVGMEHLFVVIPLVNIASSLPLSWMGLGVRENLLSLLLAPLFLTAEQAVVLGAIWFIGVTVSSAIGGVVAVLSRKETAHT